MRDVKIMQGVSGSGKSTYAKAIVDKYSSNGLICSADDFFGPEYKFDPRKLPEAHGYCMRTFVDNVQKKKDGVIVVDNTNTTVAEVAPYYAVAEAYGWSVEIVYIHCNNLEVAITRNIHKVPANVIIAMADRLNKFTNTMPNWWKRQTVKMEP